MRFQNFYSNTANAKIQSNQLCSNQLFWGLQLGFDSYKIRIKKMAILGKFDSYFLNFNQN